MCALRCKAGRIGVNDNLMQSPGAWLHKKNVKVLYG
jgi:hypothetical protein